MSETNIEKLLGIISELRDPISGCAWTKSQTLDSLKPFVLEEAKEVHIAMKNRDFDNLKEELGDLLLQIVLQSKIAEENKRFAFNEVVDNLCKKLLRRHPYVFEEKKPHTIEDQKIAWERIKKIEKSK